MKSADGTLGNVVEQAFPPLGHARDGAREIEVCCRWHERPTLAVLQRHGSDWRVYRPFRLPVKLADDLGEPRGGLLPLAGFEGPSDLGRRRRVTLWCRRDCRRPVRWVALRGLYDRADAAWAAGDRMFPID
jgi:hypothetical protein